MNFPIDWGQVNALLLVAVIGYVWRQGTITRELRQALLGFGKQTGALEELKILRERMHVLSSTLTTLQLSVSSLTDQIRINNERRSVPRGE